MEKSVLDKLCKEIYKQFPIVKDQSPEVTLQANDRYLLVFSTTGSSPDGKTLKQKIRVVANESGQILKTSMSR